MSEKNLLILQSDRELSEVEMQKLRNDIFRNIDLGAILLPPYVKVLNIPDGKIDGELVVMNCGEYKPEQWVIRDESGCYFKSFGQSSGTATIWESDKDAALKYDSELAATITKQYLSMFYDCHNLKVEEFEETSDPKLYVIKTPSNLYLRRRITDTCVLEFTEYKGYAQKFYKETAERIIAKNLDNRYTLEEA